MCCILWIVTYNLSLWLESVFQSGCRQLLRDRAVLFAGYKIPHPLEHRLIVKASIVVNLRFNLTTRSYDQCTPHLYWAKMNFVLEQCTHNYKSLQALLIIDVLFLLALRTSASCALVAVSLQLGRLLEISLRFQATFAIHIMSNITFWR